MISLGVTKGESILLSGLVIREKGRQWLAAGTQSDKVLNQCINVVICLLERGIGWS